MDKFEKSGLLIKRINDAVTKRANNDLKKLGITRSQLQLLLMLETQSDGALSLKDLEKRLCVTQQTAAGIVMRLEEKGFVSYAGTNEDKRVKLAVLTPEGREACQKARIYMDDTERQVVSTMTESEKQQFQLLLSKSWAALRGVASANGAVCRKGG